jgi:hypothetical protein
MTNCWRRSRRPWPRMRPSRRRSRPYHPGGPPSPAPSPSLMTTTVLVKSCRRSSTSPCPAIGPGLRKPPTQSSICRLKASCRRTTVRPWYRPRKTSMRPGGHQVGRKMMNGGAWRPWPSGRRGWRRDDGSGPHQVVVCSREIRPAATQPSCRLRSQSVPWRTPRRRTPSLAYAPASPRSTCMNGERSRRRHGQAARQ